MTAALTRSARQARIAELIAAGPVTSQTQLATLLARDGVRFMTRITGPLLGLSFVLVLAGGAGFSAFFDSDEPLSDEPEELVEPDSVDVGFLPLRRESVA